MKLTAQDLLGFGVAEEVVPEPLGGAQLDPAALYACLDAALEKNLTSLRKLNGAALQAQRYKKFRQIGQ